MVAVTPYSRLAMSWSPVHAARCWLISVTVRPQAVQDREFGFSS